MRSLLSADTFIKASFFVLEYWIFFISLYPRNGKRVVLDSLLLLVASLVFTAWLFDVDSYVKSILYDLAIIVLCSCFLVFEIHLQPYYALYLSSIFNLCRGTWNRQKTIFLFPQAASLPIPVHFFIRELVGIAIIAAMIKFFVHVEKDREISGLELLAGTFPAYAMYLSSFAIFFYLFVFSGIESSEGQRIFNLVGFFLAAARLISIAVQEAYFTKTKAETDLVLAKEQLQRQSEQFSQERANDEKLKSVYHDMANHLTMLEHMTNEESVREYVHSLKEETNASLTQVETGNETLNLLISQKSRRCSDLGLKLEAAIYFPHSSFLSPLEICALFSNPIDNAIEAVLSENSADRTIRVNGKEEHNCFVVRFENSFSGTLKDGLKTSKTGGIHGYGLKNVRTILEMHDGTMQIRAQENRFILTMLIPLKQS